MQIEHIKLAELKRYERNARTHPKKQIDLLVENIKEFGFTTPILVDKENSIIAGHGRLEALEQLKWESAPCVRMENLTEAQVNALRFADNKLAELAEWDKALALADLAALAEESAYLFNLTGFDADILVKKKKDDDDIPDVKQSRSTSGDLYEIGKHRVLCGDSTSKDDVARLMNGKEADMVFTDPPYNIDYVGKTKDALKIHNDAMGNTEFSEFLDKVYRRIHDSMKSGAAYYVCAPPDDVETVFRNTLENKKLAIRQCISWVKNTMVMGHSDYHYQHESILYGWKEGTHKFYGDRTWKTVWKDEPTDEELLKWARKQLESAFEGTTDIWYIDKPSSSREHPTMKPVDLITKALRNSSKRNEIVLDTFLGSGSTLIACEKTGRICYGMELDTKYIDVIIQRYVNYAENPVVKKNGEDVTSEWPKTKTEKEPTEKINTSMPEIKRDVFEPLAT